MALTHVQPHYNRVRQVEPCRQALILIILAFDAMPKHQQQQRQLDNNDLTSIELVILSHLYLDSWNFHNTRKRPIDIIFGDKPTHKFVSL